MTTEDGLENLHLQLDSGFQFTEDQANVMQAFHEGSGRVAVGSGAGTGKTATLTRVVAESIIRMTGPDHETVEDNPFDEILVTTFTRDAAGQLKTKIKQLLRQHEAQTDTEFDPAIWRWIETDSNISTIDSFIGDLLREIAPEVYVAPGFEIRDEIETEELLREITRTLREEEHYEEALNLLEQVLDDTTPRQYIFNIQQKLREACYEFPEPDAEAETTLFAEKMRQKIHNGREPPFEEADIRDITANVTGLSQSEISVPDEQELREQMEADYQHNIAFAEAVDDLVDGFEAEYDRVTREKGQLSYQDVVYIVWSYLQRDESQTLRAAMSKRFSKVFIDEFQDTSFAQCQILKHLIEPEPSESDVLVIGDVKQSIYAWRAADPEIFARLLEHAEESTDKPDPYLEAAGWTRTELATNFRSHPDLVRAGNHLFDYVFREKGLGAIGTFPIEFQPLQPYRDAGDGDDPRLHILSLGDGTADDWRERDPAKTAAAIRGMVDDDDVLINEGDTKRPVEAGDVTILFRRGTYMQSFRTALDEHGLDNTVLAERGLFASGEVGFIIDVLDWFANPHSKDSLLRILRSPVTALDDQTLRFLASYDWNLMQALENWTKDELSASDRERLTGLIDLRSDLRWDREGAKSDLVQKIIQHTGIETILLAGQNAIQRYGNLWVLVEVVRDWEEEELLAYPEFVDRLKRYRELAQSGDASFEVAQVADSSSEHTVKLRTVHSSKGLDFGVVVLADLLAGPGGQIQDRDRVNYRDPDTGKREFALRPRPADEPIPFDDGPGKKWTTDAYRSTLWVAPDRDSQGQFKYDHPFNPAIQDDLAEFWRLLYVAFTRAEDHLLLPLGDEISHHHRWSSWAHPLLNVFQTGNSWTESDTGELKNFELNKEAMHANDREVDSVSLNIDLLDFPEPEHSEPLGLPTFTETDRGRDSPTSWEGVNFAPRELNASTLHDLMACPRRYQYRALQQVSEARGTSPPETDAPSGYSPTYWGTLVHQMLEEIHEVLVETENDRSAEIFDQQIESIFEQYPDIEEHLRDLFDRYRSSELWTQVRNSTTILPEYEVSAIHPTKPQIHLTGVIDLLIETADGWEIIDFKTGTHPPEESYLEQQYVWQLRTYAWLLNEEYNLNVSGTRLFYVREGKSQPVQTNWTEFSADLKQLPDELTVESESGLPIKPEPDPTTSTADDPYSRCGSCPYVTICPAWDHD